MTHTIHELSLLYRSNKLMFDRTTFSLWNQFTGEPVNGPLRGSGIRLKMRPERWLSFGASLAKGDHGEGVGGALVAVSTAFRGQDETYAGRQGEEDRFSWRRTGAERRSARCCPGSMRRRSRLDPVVASRLKRKDYVFGMREFGAAKAWPLDVFAGGAVINDRVGDKPVVLIGDDATRSARAYYRGEASFAKADSPDRLRGPGGVWRIEEAFLRGPNGERRARAPGHVAYWFAWADYMGAKSELYDAKQ